MEKRQIILPEKRYEKASTEDLTLRVDFSETKKLLTNDDRDIVLDLNQLFNEERNESGNYKIFGKMRMIFRNMYLGSTNYVYLKDKLALHSDGSDGNFEGYLPYNEFAFLRNDLYREQTDTISITNMSTFTGLTVSTTERSTHNEINAMNAPTFNWNFYLSYVYTGDSKYVMNYTLSGSTTPLTFYSGDGIPFRISDNGAEYKLTSPVPHGMNEGEYIIIDGHTYYINTVGDEVYNSEKYVVSILKSQIPPTVNIFIARITVTGKRCLDLTNISGTTSQYYVHKLKTLTNYDDVTIDKAGFESTIFEDERKLLFENSSGDNDVLVVRNRMETIIYDFKNPFILTGLTNNLGYLPTDVYVSSVFRNGNGFFNYPPKVGYKFNFHDTWVDSSFGYNSSKESSISGDTFSETISGITYNFTSGHTLSKGTILTGAFVEYVPTEMKERIISESFYKLEIPVNTFNYGQDQTSFYSGVTANNTVGLFYQPHTRVKLRELSPYVETSNEPNIENLPQNAKYFTDEKMWKWRDLYGQGYVDDLGYGTDNPFLNNMHYVKTDINFYLRNEMYYRNKQDGMASFNSSNKINC